MFGAFYVAVSMFLLVGALNSQNNLLFGALGLAIGGLAVSGVISGASLMGLRVSRERPGEASVGRPIELRYRVVNRNRLVPAFAVRISEVAPKVMTFCPHVGCGSTEWVSATLTPTRRGRLELTGVRAETTFPFGIARKSVTFRDRYTILVRPRFLELRTAAIPPREAGARGVMAAERLPGQGDEFFGLRDYAPGDLTRQIAWRATARTGKLVVRQRSAIAPARMWVALVFGARDRTPTLDERAIALAASLVREASMRGYAVGLQVPQTGERHGPVTSRLHVEAMLNVLAAIDPPGGGAPGRVFATRGERCVVITSGGAHGVDVPGWAQTWEARDAERYVADPAALSSLEVREGRPGVVRGALRALSGMIQGGDKREGAAG